MSLELLNSVARIFMSLPAGRTIRLSEIARQVGASIEEVEPAIIHLMARGQVRLQAHRRSRPHESDQK